MLALSRRVSAFAIILVTFIFSARAVAQDNEAESERTLGTIHVTATRATAGTKTDTPLIETPQSITVITSEQIAEQNAQTMQEVLRYTAGVRSDMYGLDNRGDWFTMRGGSEGSTLLDGLRLPLSGWWGVVRNEPFAFDRIEVLRGPASVIAGQNGPGGVVNLVSKRPFAESQRQLSLQLGNYDHRQLSVDLTGPLTDGGNVLYRLVGLGKDSDTQVDHAFDQRVLIAPSLTWLASDRTTITGYAEYQSDESGNTEAFFPWSGTLLPAPNGPIPSDTFIGEPDWDTYGGDRIRVGYEVDHEFNETWALRHHLRHDRVSGELRTMYAAWWDGFLDEQGNPDPNGEYLNRIWYANDDESRITNADLLAEGQLEFGATKHRVLFGADAMDSRNDQKSWEGPATPLNVYDPVYGTFPLPPLDDVPEDRYRTRQLGLLAQDQIGLGENWIVVVGLRYDTVETSLNDDTTSDDSAWSNSLGIVYRTDSGFAPYVSYSESFEAMAGADINGDPFEPKEGKQLEAGIKYSPPGQDMILSAAAYRLEETNRLSADPTDPNFSIQIGEVTVKGIELEANVSLASWNMLANYTYTDAKQTAASDVDARYLGSRLHSIPEHSAALWAVYGFGDFGLPGLSLGGGVRYVGTTWDGTDSLATPSNTLFDAMLSYERQSWQFAINATNLTDDEYIATCLERGDCWFGTRREIVATLTRRF